MESSSTLPDALAYARDEIIRRPGRSLACATLALALGWAIPVILIASFIALGLAICATADVFEVDLLPAQIALIAGLVALVMYRDVRKVVARRRTTR